MTVPAGTKLGPYEITDAIGKGGMGEVYRARDTRLDRVVAIKVLPAELSADPERRQRLDHEARIISSVSHPNICMLLDVGHQAGIDFLVMEYLEGETLQRRLDRGALPLDQVLRYGSEIADALGKAHRGGIVHRDLKPGNIMLTKSGSKLLDFGLARLVKHSPLDIAQPDLPTATRRLTEEGVLLGTWQYMAPEQLEGQDADSRSDIFSLGSVLYEMATGQPAFTGRSKASLIAAILSAPVPAVSSLQKTSPIALDRLIKRCMEKDPDQRWQNANDLASELKWIADSSLTGLSTSGSTITGAGFQSGIASPQQQKRKLRERLAVSLVGFVLLAGLGLALIYRRPKPVPGAAMRFSLLPPEKAEFNQVVLSPDGRYLAFTTSGSKEKQGLWVRPLDSPTAQQFPGTEDAYAPFWSPDSRYMGFFAADKLKRVDASGGAPEILCSLPHGGNGAWSPNGVVLFSEDVYQPIRQINLADCSIKPVTKMDVSRKELGNTQSQFLPDGRHFLWVSNRMLPEKGLDIYVSSIDSDERHLLLYNASMPTYAAGYLVFAREGKLLAQAFDAKRLRFQGEAFAVVPERLASDHFDGTALYAISDRGVLVYMPDAPPVFQLQWHDHSGKAVGGVAETGFNRLLQLSPDGSRVLVSRSAPETQTEDAWIYELKNGAWTRFTFDPLPASEGRWSPDGREIIYLDRQNGVLSLRRKAADGSGTEETLLQLDHWLAARAQSPDGKSLLYETIFPDTGVDLWLLPLSGERKPVPFVQTHFNEGNATFSPDGRWVTYVSDKSGKAEIYARPFSGSGAEMKVSSSGTSAGLMGGSSIAVHWRGDGKELFYLSADWQVMAVPVTLGSTLQAGLPQPLFAIPPGSQFDVSPDGQRFLVNARVQGPESPPLNVVVNWTAEHNLQ
jgi:serine/threonine protein kinase